MPLSSIFILPAYTGNNSFSKNFPFHRKTTPPSKNTKKPASAKAASAPAKEPAPKSDTKTIAKIKAAVQAAYEEGQSKLKGSGKSVPALSVLKTPLRDGDLERPDDEAYANSFFLNANSSNKPGIVDADRNPIFEQSEVYSGVYGRASINFYAFNTNGNKGIACGLNNLQKISDGEPLGGMTRAADDFDDGFVADTTDDGDDDFLS